MALPYEIPNPLKVVSDTLTAPPANSVQEGAAYVVAATATGAWATFEGHIALWRQGAWTFIFPVEGMLIYVTATDTLKSYSGSAWAEVGGGGTVAELDDIGDVETYPADSRLLFYDSDAGTVKWTDGATWDNVDKVLTVTSILSPGGDTDAPLRVANGAAATPSITFTEDTDTGLIRSDANKLGLVTGGAERVTVDADGDVGIGTDTPSSTLHIDGGVGSLATGLAFGDGDSGLYETYDDQLILNAGGNDVIKMTTAGIGGRIGLMTASLNYAVNIGGEKSIAFVGGAGTVVAGGNLTLSNGTAANIILATGPPEIRLCGANGGAAVSLTQIETYQIPLMIKQKSGGTTPIISIQNSSGVQTMGFSTTGLTQGAHGVQGIKRFDIDHIIQPTSADGDGVGLALRTENVSGNMTDIAFIDAVYDEIGNAPATSADVEVSLRFSVRVDGDTAPAEVMRIEGNAGNIGIGTDAPIAEAILDVQSTTQALKLPVMTESQMEAISNAAGLICYVSDLRKVYFNTGADWIEMTSA